MRIGDFFVDTTRIKEFLFVLIVVTIPYKINFGNIALILAVLYNVYFWDKNQFKNLKRFSVIFPVLFFIITVFSGLFSDDLIKGISQLDKQLVLVLIVFILLNTKLNNTMSEKIFKSFFVATIIGTLVLIFRLLLKLMEGFSIHELVFHEFTSFYSQHPVYFSLYLSLCLFYAILTNKCNLRLRILGIVIIILGLLFCASKAVIFIDFVILFFFFLARRKSIKKRIFYLVTLVVFTVGFFNVPFVKSRFLDGLTLNKEITEFTPSNYFSKKKYFTYNEKNQISDLELRVLFLKIGLYHIIEDDKIYFGYGQGDTQNYIDYYLYSYNLGPNWFGGFNVHNQYLHILLNYGLIALVLFIAYLVYSFVHAIRLKDQLHFFFLLSVCFVFIFEVLLVRNKGIIFFYFFNTLFLLKHNQIENRDTRN